MFVLSICLFFFYNYYRIKEKRCNFVFNWRQRFPILEAYISDLYSVLLNSLRPKGEINKAYFTLTDNTAYYLDYSDSKMDIFSPDNSGSLYEGIFSGGDITCLRRANQKRPVTVEGQRLHRVVGDVTRSQRDQSDRKFKRTSSVQRTSCRSKF